MVPRAVQRISVQSLLGLIVAARRPCSGGTHFTLGQQKRPRRFVSPQFVGNTVSPEQAAHAKIQSGIISGNQRHDRRKQLQDPAALQSTSRLAEQDPVNDSQPGKKIGNRLSVSPDTKYGSKLADALWSMESNGVLVDEKPNRTALSKDEQPDAADEFVKLSKMTPAERLRYFFLKDRELNEDKLAAMSQRDREAIEQQIKDVILQQLGLEDEDGKPNDAAQPAAEGTPISLDSTP